MNEETEEPSALAMNWGIHAGTSPMQKVWEFVKTIPRPLALNEIRNYYVERIALYFGLLDYMHSWILFPAAVGIATTVMQQLNWYDPRAEKAPTTTKKP